MGKEKNGTLTQSEINSAQTQVTQARKVDVDDAKKELQKEIKEIKTDQTSKLVELQQQFKSSVDNVEEILVENNNLKKQLTGISKELENVRMQLGQDSEIQQQLKELIIKQNEMIEQQKAEKIEPEAEFDLGSFLSNPFVLGLLMVIPGLLIVFAVVMFLRKRASKDDVQSDDDFLPQTPTYANDDDLDTQNIEDPIVPEPLDDLSIQLDDSLENDILPDDDTPLPDGDIAFDDSLEDFTESDSLLDQDELESLLSDDIVFDDENIEDDELDIFMQQDFDKSPDDSPEGDIDLDSPLESSNSDDILSNDDLDSLFNEDDGLSEFDSPQTNDIEEDNSLESNDEMAALSEELAEDDDFDIDDLLDQTNTESDLGNTEDSLSSEKDDFDLDDIDSLIDQATDDSVDEVLVEESDDFDLDDIDSLIDDAGDDSAADALVEEKMILI